MKETVEVLSLESFLKLFEYAKLLKKKYIYINRKVILGTDDDFCSLSRLYLPINAYNFNEEISSFFKLNTDNHSTSIFFNKNEIIALIKDNKFGYIQRTNSFNSIVYDQAGYSHLWVGNSPEMQKIKNMHIKVASIARPENVIYQLDNMRSNAQIMDTLSLKASEGMNMINLEGNIVTMYGGMYPITSKDKVSMKLYDCKDSSTLSELKITKAKPKDLVISSYIRYRSLL